MTKAWSCALVLVVVGCGQQPTADLQGQVFTRTIVVKKNGVTTTKTESITRAEQLAEIAQRKQFDAQRAGGIQLDSFHSDSSCAGSDLWVFDYWELTGDEICFFSDNAYEGDYLSNYALGGGTWSQKVRSYYPGSQAGYFDAPSCGPECYCDEGFSAWGAWTDAGTCAQEATSVWFTSN